MVSTPTFPPPFAAVSPGNLVPPLPTFPPFLKDQNQGRPHDTTKGFEYPSLLYPTLSRSPFTRKFRAFNDSPGLAGDLNGLPPSPQCFSLPCHCIYSYAGPLPPHLVSPLSLEAPPSLAPSRGVWEGG